MRSVEGQAEKIGRVLKGGVAGKMRMRRVFHRLRESSSECFWWDAGRGDEQRPS